MEYKVKAVKESLSFESALSEGKWEIECTDTDDENADIFSVYYVFENGTDVWLADFLHRADAELFARVKGGEG